LNYGAANIDSCGDALYSNDSFDVTIRACLLSKLRMLKSQPETSNFTDRMCFGLGNRYVVLQTSKPKEDPRLHRFEALSRRMV
jgi:hypothetical protein